MDYVAEVLSERSIKDAGIFDPVPVHRLLAKCRSGAAIGFADNMAFLIALTTQLLHGQYVGGSSLT